MKTPKHVVATALTSWIEKAGDHPATQVVLRHVGEGRPPVKVQSWEIVWPGTNISELVNTILDTATEHAHNGKAVSSEEYHLIPFFGVEKEEGAQRRFCISVSHSANSDEDGVSYTEGPTKAGQVHMGMRHLEKRHDQLDQRDALLWSDLRQQLKELREENKGLRHDLRAANEGLEEAKDRSLERKLRIYLANEEVDRKNKLVAAVIPVGMMLGNAVMGAPVFQVDTNDQSQQAMISFLSSIKPKQLEHIYGGLDPQQRIFFDHVLEEIKKMKMEERAQKQAEAQNRVGGVEQDSKTVENLAKRASSPEGP